MNNFSVLPCEAHFFIWTVPPPRHPQILFCKMLSLSSWVVANGWHKLVKSHPHIINYGTTTLLNLPTCALKFHKKHKTKKKGIVTLALTIKKYLNINVKNIITYFSVQHVSPSISPTIICLYVYKWTDTHTHTQTHNTPNFISIGFVILSIGFCHSFIFLFLSHQNWENLQFLYSKN